MRRITDGTVPLDRRSLLACASVLGLASLPGCSDLTNQEFVATKVGLDDESLNDLGYDVSTDHAITEESGGSVGPLEGSIRVESQLAVYSKGETADPPSEQSRWTGTDATLAQWSNGATVRGTKAGAVLDSAVVESPKEDESAVESFATGGADVLASTEAAERGAVQASDLLFVMPGDNATYANERDDGTVEVSDAYDLDPGTLLPEGTRYPFDAD